MQICTLTQTHNHASIPPLSFLQAGCPSCRPTNSVKAYLHNTCVTITKMNMTTQFIIKRSLLTRIKHYLTKIRKHRQLAAKPAACANSLSGLNLACDVGQWSMLIGLISSGSVYCVAHVGQKTAKISQFRPNFRFCGGSCAHPFTNLGQI